MQELSTLELPILIDMLSDHTARYSRLLMEGDKGDEYEARKKLIKLIQAEIESRIQSEEKSPALDQKKQP